MVSKGSAVPHLISRLTVSMAKGHSKGKITTDVTNDNGQENQVPVKKCTHTNKQNFTVKAGAKFRSGDVLSLRPLKGPLVEWFTFTSWPLVNQGKQFLRSAQMARHLVSLCLTLLESQGPGK